ncbi:MAG: M23 family metallopeptidase [Bacteroidota bacterium]
MKLYSKRLIPTLLTLYAFSLFACKDKPESTTTDINQSVDTKTVQEFDSLYIAYSFDFPVGIPDAKGYYIAQKFQENSHLGDDWNAVTGGNSDLGDPIYAVANGYVKVVKNYGGGWGNVIRIIHQQVNGEMVESLYAHCDTVLVKEKQWIKKGAQIGTIGTANGAYLAHLHFEMRSDLELPLGPGYSNETKGYLNPTRFIKANR